MLRNRGYYFFRPDYIEYLADSTITPGSIALRMTVASNIPHTHCCCHTAQAKSQHASTETKEAAHPTPS